MCQLIIISYTEKEFIDTNFLQFLRLHKINCKQRMHIEKFQIKLQLNNLIVILIVHRFQFVFLIQLLHVIRVRYMGKE